MKTSASFIFFLASLIPFFGFTQELKEVTFVVRTPDIPENSVVTIAGNHEALGNWDPQRIELYRDAPESWSRTIVLPSGRRIEFKIMRASWETEAVYDGHTIPDNHTLFITSDTSVYITVPYWKDRIKIKNKGQITGEVEFIHNFYGTGLLPRDITIWLPPSYRIHKNLRYPVIYFHDGQNSVDPATSFGGIDWQIDETADSLIAKNQIDEFILVGIYNTKNRWQEYSPGDTGYAYMNFVVNELKPVIDERYRTKPQRDFTYTMGSSMGGLISLMLLWNYPEIFSKAVCVSPAFKIRGLDYISDITSYNGPKKNISIYIDNGGIGLEDSLQAGINDMLGTLQSLGFVLGEDLIWYKDLYAEHNERDWAKRVWRHLIFLLGKNY